MSENKITFYDTTLRDGAQGPRVKFSSDDQIRIVKELDAFGVSYIEGGQPGSNPTGTNPGCQLMTHFEAMPL